MAEIHVQKKKSSGFIWILALAAVALALLAFAGIWGRDDGEIDQVATTPVPVTPAPGVAPTTGVGDPIEGEVADFLTFANAPASDQVGRAHDYTAEGIRRLSRALNAVIEQQRISGTPVQEQLTAFRTKADRIQADPQAIGHANQVRDVFTSAADLMAAAQQERWPEAADLRGQISEVRSAATGINETQPLLDQTSTVQTFFERAAGVLRSMSNRS